GKPRVTYPLSNRYIDWVKEKIRTDPDLFKEYKQNRGIIHVRNLFLEQLNNAQLAQLECCTAQDVKTLIFPVATIGCGKTTLSLALSILFKFAHIQNDNITGKKARVEFYNNIIEGFGTHDVVIADRNNHLVELRKTLMNAVRGAYPNVRIVVIYWDHSDRSLNEIFQITSQRVVSRGSNHQSLTPENPEYEQVVWRFLKDFEPLDSNNGVDDKIDNMIELNISNDIKTSLMITVEQLCSILGVKIPNEIDISNALKEATNYKPTVRKIVSKTKSKSRSSGPGYFMIALDFDVSGYLSNYFANHPKVDSRTYKKLIHNKRIPDKHHVTLIHKSDLLENQELWEQYKNICTGDPFNVKVHIDKLVFDEKIMAFSVNAIEPPHVRSVNRIPHVTIGTIDNSVPSVHSNDMLVKALIENKKSEVTIVLLEPEVVCDGIIKSGW
ncbi:6379_t:CDS:2, partial [Acaulospora morrowiae]